MLLSLAVVSFSSVRTLLLKPCSDSVILRLASVMPICMRLIWARDWSISPLARFASRSNFKISISDTAPLASKGLFAANSLLADSNVFSASSFLNCTSISSFWRCSIWSRAMFIIESNSSRLALYSASSCSYTCALSCLISAGGLNAPPSASAFKRACLASNDKYCDWFSRSDDLARVSSILISGEPTSTISPSLIKISDTIPPSNDWIICTWREGITRPSPRVTSSTLANQAQIKAASIRPKMQYNSFLAFSGACSTIAKSASSFQLKSSRLCVETARFTIQ